MRRGGEHGSRPSILRYSIFAMELLDTSSEATWITADFIQGSEPIETIEGSVFNRLGHHRPGELLEAHGQFLFERTADPQQEYISQEVEKPSVQLRRVGFSCIQSFTNISFIIGMKQAAFGAQISTVDRKMSSNRPNHLVQFVARIVAVMPM